MSRKPTGPLQGVRVVEMAGIGPAPFCCMLLADMGADVIRVERTGAAAAIPRHQFLQRGRRSIALDLKHPRGVEVVQRLLTDCDALVEGFRPGVMERLGLGPDECLASNPRLVYGRMTGWGQDGPLAQLAGHDINFISVTGALHAIGPAGGLPVPPLNLVADFGGGALYLALGIVSALYETRGSGAGQVVDASMVDGTASLMTSLFGAMARGEWRNQRGANLLDGGAPWYSVYETRDGKLVSIGAIEPQFYGELVRLMGLDAATLPDRSDRSQWPALRAVLDATFKSKTRDEWCALLGHADTCFTPVLDAHEARSHRHLAERAVLIESDGAVQPAPAPRFSRTPSSPGGPPAAPGTHTVDVLRQCRFTDDEIDGLIRSGAVA